MRLRRSGEKKRRRATDSRIRSDHGHVSSGSFGTWQWKALVTQTDLAWLCRSVSKPLVRSQWLEQAHQILPPTNSVPLFSAIVAIHNGRRSQGHGGGSQGARRDVGWSSKTSHDRQVERATVCAWTAGGDDAEADIHRKFPSQVVDFSKARYWAYYRTSP